MIAAVFSMQGFGQLFAAIIAMIMAVAFKRSYLSILDESLCDDACRLAADRSWRVIVGVGAIPACLALYYRITIPETPRYTFDVQFDVEKADADIRAYVSSKPKGEIHTTCCGIMCQHQATQVLNVPKASWSDLRAYFSEWSHLKILIGTSMSWFFLVGRKLGSSAAKTGINIRYRTWRTTASDLIAPPFCTQLASPKAIRCTTNSSTKQSA